MKKILWGQIKKGRAQIARPTVVSTVAGKNTSQQSLFKKIATIVGLVLALQFFAGPKPALVKADAPDPVVASTVGNYVINGDGTITLMVNGEWEWTTHNTDCNLDRFGVGWNVDWNDSSQPGNVVGTINSVTVDVGALADNGLNLADNEVHYSDSAPFCGIFSAGFNSGDWGPLSHTYPAGTTTFAPCVVTYDIHKGNKKNEPLAPKAADLVAGGTNANPGANGETKHNNDNSVQANVNTPLGNGCFSASIQQLIVVKQVNGGPADASDFTMNVDANNPSQSSFPGDESGTAVLVDVGSYTVTEDDQPNYIGSADAGCSGTIAAGETKICTITNTFAQPQLTVIKEVENNDNPEPLDVEDFPLFVGETPVTSGEQNGFDAGDYVVSETNQPNYTPVFSGDCDSQGNVNLALSDEKTCTITNTFEAPPPPEPATLHVIKQVVGDNADPASSFTINVSGTNVSDTSFPGDDAGTDITLDPGDYSVTEVELEGYDVDYSEDCEGTVEEGDEKTCTITNTKLGRIIIDKVTDPSESSQVFNFDASYDEDGFTLTDQQDPNDSGFLAPDTYTVSETDIPEFWDLDSVECDYGDQEEGQSDPNGVEIILGAGDVVTCTFTNKFTPPPTGTLKVIKQVVGGEADADEFSMHVKSDGSDVDGSPQAGDENGTDYVLPTGPYTVSESDGPSNYDATFSENCPDGNITVVLNETVTCTVTNTFRESNEPSADLEVTKEVNDQSVLTGQQVTYTINVTNHGPDTATNVIVTDALPSGLDFVSEDSPVGDYDENTNIWTIGTLTDGQTVTLTIVAEVTASSGQTVLNEADVTLDPDIDVNTDNDHDEIDITVDRRSGGGGVSGGSTPPPGRILGETNFPPSIQMPQVLGETTPPLPRTGMSVTALLALLLGGLALWKITEPKHQS